MGVCPFHPDKNPSFFVNEIKNVGHCFGCQWSGDVFDFVIEMEGVDFKGALAHLGLAVQSTPTHKPQTSVERETGRHIAAWASEVSLAISGRLRDIGWHLQVAQDALGRPGVDKSSLGQEIKRIQQEWTVMETIDEDLFNPDLVMELWAQRAVLEAMVNG